MDIDWFMFNPYVYIGAVCGIHWWPDADCLLLILCSGSGVLSGCIGAR
jgi:hypothetical protein